MLQQASSAPSAHRTPRQSNRLSSTHQPNRGGIHKRNTTPSRVDKDGDLLMEPGSKPQSDRTSRSGRGTTIGASSEARTQNITEPLNKRGSTRPTKTAIDPAAIQRAVFRGMGSKDGSSNNPKRSSKRFRSQDRGSEKELRKGLDNISVYGLKQSRAARNEDGGISDLIAFLERKATNPDTPARESVKIKKSRIEGDALIVSVRPQDTPKILRIDNYSFAGAPLKIEGPLVDSTPLLNNVDSETPNTIELLKAVLSRRYNVGAKLLDLSQVGNDPELVNIGMFNSASRESKFFPALMKICDGLFTSQEEKEDAVVSVSLANNGLPDVSAVTTLSQTFPAIKNLDLSNNLIPDLKALQGWRWKFRKLDHLIISGNPIDAKESNLKEEMLKWYPALTTLNNIPVRSIDDLHASKSKQHPFPISGPSFCDENSIGEIFLKQFFLGYDSDRSTLVQGYYDLQSTFSLSVNTSAPRAPEEATTQTVGNWENYIRHSRNLAKVTHPLTRMSRMYTGIPLIKDCFNDLPATRHPDILADPQKWCIECHTIPGLPDPTGQSIGGVGGLIITVHGEFAEVDVSKNKFTTTRSFDRTFILGPGGGVGGIRVICDALVLRAYGGYAAWKPTDEISQPLPVNTRPSQSANQPQVPVPKGFGMSAPGKTEEQIQKEILAVELSRATRMTLEYSGMCLQQSNWNLERARVAFEQAKPTLPPEAFL